MRVYGDQSIFQFSQSVVEVSLLKTRFQEHFSYWKKNIDPQQLQLSYLTFIQMEFCYLQFPHLLNILSIKRI